MAGRPFRNVKTLLHLFSIFFLSISTIGIHFITK